MNSFLLILFLRLERNQEREKESANLEYMKNVILQFLKCRPNEREHLVPVLTTMLKLSQDEKELIVQLARGMMWIHEVTLKYEFIPKLLHLQIRLVRITYRVCNAHVLRPVSFLTVPSYDKG